jgi:hypothetical protein
MDAQNSKRVRINAVQDAKGFFKLDVTAEIECAFEVAGDPVAIASAMLVRTINTARADMTANGMKYLADPVADK